MAEQRIAVGLDGTSAARQALAWAAAEARRRGATLRVITAWPDESRAAARAGGALPAERARLGRMQGDFLASATAWTGLPPAVTQELVLGDPVAALCHAAGRADLLVLGGDPADPASIGAAVFRRLAGDAGKLVFVAAPGPSRAAPDRSAGSARPTGCNQLAALCAG